MSEEEKKAIEIVLDFAITHINDFESEDDFEYIETVKKLIEKQQKDIEELQKDKKALVKNYDKVLGTYINKDKIRDKIKELEKEKENKRILPFEIIEEQNKNIKYKIEILEELLEE